MKIILIQALFKWINAKDNYWQIALLICTVDVFITA